MAKKKDKEETPDAVEEELNIKRELFCRYYTQNDDTFGNATLSYGEAFGYKLDELPQDDEVRDSEGRIIEASSYDKAYKVCSVMGHRLLRIASIQRRNVVLLNELLTDATVDSELAKVIKQNHKLDPKVAAIKEFNKLRGRIIDKSKVTQVQKLDMDDIRVLISVLPPERQDEFYATITTILAEADQLRGGSAKVPGSSSERPSVNPA